jgi:hypothetical protein
VSKEERAENRMRQRLPTELIGSYALPSWLHIAIERVERQADLGAADIRETLDDAVTIAVSDQERAGLDVVTDGEMRRRDFIQNFYGRLTGLQKIKPARTCVAVCGRRTIGHYARLRLQSLPAPHRLPQDASNGRGREGRARGIAMTLWRWLAPPAVALLIWLCPHAGFDAKSWGLLRLFASTITGLISQPLPAGAVLIIIITIANALGVVTLADKLNKVGLLKAFSNAVAGLVAGWSWPLALALLLVIFVVVKSFINTKG